MYLYKHSVEYKIEILINSIDTSAKWSDGDKYYKQFTSWILYLLLPLSKRCGKFKYILCKYFVGQTVSYVTGWSPKTDYGLEVEVVDMPACHAGGSQCKSGLNRHHLWIDYP